MSAGVALNLRNNISRKKRREELRARFKMFCKSVQIICGICIHLEKLMNKAIPEDSWLKLSEKYLYPKQKTHSQTEKLKAVAPKSVATMAMAKALFLPSGHLLSWYLA